MYTQQEASLPYDVREGLDCRYSNPADEFTKGFVFCNLDIHHHSHDAFTVGSSSEIPYTESTGNLQNGQKWWFW